MLGGWRRWKGRTSIAVLALAIAGWVVLLAHPSPADECVAFLNAEAYPAAIEAGRRAVYANPRDVHAQSCLTLAYFRHERARVPHAVQSPAATRPM